MDFATHAYFAALILGAVHALEVDHMVAVTVFTGLKPRMSAAARYGARWGLGHGLVVVLVGGLLAFLNVQLAERYFSWGELLVGVALIALGLWALKVRRQFHAHRPLEHDHHHESLHGHLHAHPSQAAHHHNHIHNPRRHHQHLPTAMGALHGLAGSAPVLALIPVTLLDTTTSALIYLTLFSVGTTASMTIYALLAAATVHGFGLSQQRVAWVTTAISLATIAVGIWWSIKALSGLLLN